MSILQENSKHDRVVYILPLTGVASASLPLQYNFCPLQGRKQVVYLDFVLFRDMCLVEIDDFVLFVEPSRGIMRHLSDFCL